MESAMPFWLSVLKFGSFYPFAMVFAEYRGSILAFAKHTNKPSFSCGLRQYHQQIIHQTDPPVSLKCFAEKEHGHRGHSTQFHIGQLQDHEMAYQQCQMCRQLSTPPLAVGFGSDLFAITPKHTCHTMAFESKAELPNRLAHSQQRPHPTRSLTKRTPHNAGTANVTILACFNFSSRSCTDTFLNQSKGNSLATLTPAGFELHSRIFLGELILGTG